VLGDLSDADCAEVDGLMIFRQFVTAKDMARFPRLRAIVRMGVGYDRIDRQAAAERNIMVCNVPDYGTMEVADHAIALALALRRGILLHHETQRHSPPAAWTPITTPLIRRLSVQTFGIVGLGRIGTAAALRAKAFGFRVMFFDPYLPNGADRALGIERAPTLEALLKQTDTLSLHTPLTPETRNMLGRAELSMLPAGAVVVNTARGPIIDLDALGELLKSGHIAGAGLDVIPVEPPVEPVPELLRAYRAKEAWLEGRLVITPHSAFHTPEAWDDIRTKSAETMRAALLSDRPQNVIRPDSY
jgi:C-terminal binding protein